MVIVLSHPAKSYAKIRDMIVDVLYSYGYINHVKPNSVIVIGNMTEMPRPEYKHASTIVYYLDIPVLVPLAQRNLYRRYRDKMIVIGNSKYTCDIAERYLNIKCDCVVHHGVYSNIWSRYVNNVKLFDTCYFCTDPIRKGLRHFLTVVYNTYGLKHLVFHVSDSVLPFLSYPSIITYRIGNVGEDVLARYVSHCRVLVCTSLHEGFYMPAIESACCGVVPLVPDIPPYTEHDVPFEFRYDADIDIDMIVKVGRYLLPKTQLNIDDCIRKLYVAVRFKPSITDVKYVCHRYNYVRMAIKVIEHVLHR